MMNFLQKEDIPISDDDGFNWYFGGVSQKDGLIVGKLGRIRKNKTRTYFDRNARDFIEVPDEKEDGAFSYFFIDMNRFLIIFETRWIIGRRQFINIFTKAYNHFYDQKKCIEIDFLKDKKEVSKILSQAEKLLSAKFNLRPTNPVTDEEMDLID